MAEIKIDIDYDQELTTFKVSGKLLAGELLESTKAYHQGETTDRVLCDFTNASWSEIAAEDLKKNTGAAKKYSSKGNRTAFVFSNDLDFGMGRMLTAYAENEEFDSDMGVFRSLDAAMEWLTMNP